MLIWVASYPRSGNNLFMITLRDAFGVAERGTVFEEGLGLGRLSSVRAAPYQMPRELQGLANDDLLDVIRERPEPYFVKTHHICHAVDPAPAIHIVRDGRDSLVSYAHFVVDHEQDPLFDGLTLERRLSTLISVGYGPFGTWSNHVHAWRTRSAPTSRVRFEQLVEDPAVSVSTACADLGVELRNCGRRPPAFSMLHERHPTFFRRGEVGGWRTEMPSSLEERFWRAHGREMTALSYSR